MEYGLSRGGPGALDGPEELRVGGMVSDLYLELSEELLDLQGEALLDRIVEMLAQRLGFDVALAGELIADGTAVRTAAMFAHGAHAEPIVYALAGSPCEEAGTAGLCVIPSGVAARFPTDQTLAAMHAESYVGIPIHGVDGALLGILAVIGQPMTVQTCRLATNVLRLAAGRCAHALAQRIAQRRQAEQARQLRAQLTHLQLQSRISTRLLAAADFDTAIQSALQDICETLGVGRASISERREDGAFQVSFCHAAQGRPSNRGQWLDRAFPWYWKQLTTRPVFVATHLPDSLPPEAKAERRYCASIGMRGVLAMPLRARGEFVSSFALYDFEERTWTSDEVRAVRIVGELMLSALLRKRSTDRRAQLEAQLARAQKLEALGTLASGVAHDFNNMLMGIRGTVEVVSAQLPASSPLIDQLADALQATDRAAELTREILLFARMTPPTRAEALGLADTIQSAANLLRRTVPATISVVTQITDAHLAACIDPAHLYQLVVNLGTNAYHAIGDRPAGRIEVILRRDGEQAIIEVSDDGAGMDAAIKQRVFDPFFTTKSVGEGTGLGLSVVHSIVTSCKGHIELESAPGEGTTVRVSLPVAELAPTLPSDDDDALIFGGGEHIVVVDDEPLVLKPVTRLLKFLGYAVEGYTSPAEALGALVDDGQPVDLLITDQTMPEMSGEDLIKAVTRRRGPLPAILCTGIAAIGELSADSGTLLLPKPLSLDMLSQAVREALDAPTPPVWA